MRKTFTRKAFTAGDAIIFCAVMFMVVFVVVAIVRKHNDSPKAEVETKIDDANLGRFDDARIITLPTGERVLILSGPNGLSACCLLPPKPELKVEK